MHSLPQGTRDAEPGDRYVRMRCVAVLVNGMKDGYEVKKMRVK